jgi:hypothetical protein
MPRTLVGFAGCSIFALLVLECRGHHSPYSFAGDDFTAGGADGGSPSAASNGGWTAGQAGTATDLGGVAGAAGGAGEQTGAAGQAGGAGRGGSSGKGGSSGRGGSDARGEGGNTWSAAGSDAAGGEASAAGGVAAAGNGSSDVSGGEGGASGEGGSSGADGSGASGFAGSGEAGGPSRDEQPVLQPYCFSGVAFPLVTFPTPTAIAAARVAAGQQTTLFASSTERDAMAVGWQVTPGDDTSWDLWHCFDALLRPRRLSADNLPNGEMEVFATTDGGALFVRRSYSLGGFWSGWELMSAPFDDSRMSDVASAEGEQPHLYVVDRGRIFYRHHLDETGDDSYAAYSGWYRVPESGAVAVAAVEREDGRQVLFRGTLSSIDVAVQASAELGSPFGAWSSFPSEGITPVDLEAVSSGADIVLLTLDKEGRVWRASSTSQGFTAPALLPAPATVRFLSLASRMYPDGEPQLYALADDRNVYVWESTTSAWRRLD